MPCHQRVRQAVPTLLLCLLAGLATPPPGVGRAAERPHLAPVRADEDWRALADPVLRTAPLDGLKLVLLGPDRSLTLGGEVRLLHEYFAHEAWGLGSQQDGGSWLLRALLHADVRWGGHLRLFGQLGTGQEHGRPGGPRPADESDLYANALFLEIGAEPAPGHRVDLRLGRMELSYGWGRLVSFRGRPTLKRSHDGGLLRWRQGRGRTDLFLTWGVRRRPGVLDSERLDDHRLAGLYHAQPLGGGHGLDLYVLGSDRPAQAYWLVPGDPAPRAGGETRWSLGARWQYRGARLRHDTEVTWQTGSFAPDGGRELDIAALGLGTMTRLRWAGPHAPEIGLDLGWTSGDTDPDDGTLGTFRAPAPGAGFLGGGHPLGYGNLGLAHVLAAAGVAPAVRMQAGVFWFWRPAAQNGTHALPGRPLLPAAGGRSLGLVPELIVTWDAAPYTEVRVEVDWAPATGYQDQVTPGADILFVSSQVTLQF